MNDASIDRGPVPVSGSANVPSWPVIAANNISAGSIVGYKLDMSAGYKIDSACRIEMHCGHIIDVYYTTKSGDKILIFSKAMAESLEEREHMQSREGIYRGTVDEI